VHPGSPQFTEVLNRLEASLAYLDAHLHFKDAPLYR
jgi:hypothetical protein